MSHKLRALVRIDLNLSTAAIHVTGCLTTTNYKALVPVVRRARALPGHPAVSISITHAGYVESAAIDLLDAACLALTTTAGDPVVPIIGTDIGDTHPVGSTTAGRNLKAPITSRSRSRAS